MSAHTISRRCPPQGDAGDIFPSNSRRRQLLQMAPALAAAGMAPWGKVAAAAYPDHPIRVIVPFAPGGGNDFIGRFIAQQLGRGLGQPAVVDNRAGAGGVIGVEEGAKAPADGYTLTLIGLSYAVNPSLYKLSFDPVKDITPIGKVSDGALVMVVPASLKARTLQEFVAMAKAEPGKINYATSGAGSIIHLATAHFASLAGIDMVHVPYKGGGPALSDTLTGRTQLFISSIPEALPHVKAGKLRALAVTTSTRNNMLPDVPTAAEAGLGGFEVSLWNGLIGPKGMPAPVVRRLNEEIGRALARPDAVKVLENAGYTAAPDTPEQFGRTIAEGLDLWGRVAREVGVKPE
ncbi:tripartite tricarboxylate transporter substrate binding protein [Pigmentiphaga soli]|uniref:Tripartite tricarboxylate transporter substrate binding protein n=1 Tax=Pigmentiphaga soli TaxID=1007095 RepID=A0ABP8HQS8_9BURK